MAKIFEGISNADYHSRPEISNSDLSMISRDCHLMQWKRHCPTDPAKLKTLDFGSAVHTKLLEPHLFDSEYAIMPKFDGRTKQGKADKEAWLMANKGKTYLTTDEKFKIDLMYDSVMSHPVARSLIEAEGLVEPSIFWQDAETGIQCRCRPDKIITGGPLVDVKTTEKLADFKYSVEDYRYFVQAAYYQDGCKAAGIDCGTMQFLVVGKTIELGRYPVMVVTLPYELVEYGRMTYQYDLHKWAKFLADDKPLTVNELTIHNSLWSKIEDAQLEAIQ
jgi:exodeoxyribonuclease VIII